MSTAILTCSALEDYVNAAQKTMKTDYPVIKVDRNYHDRPKILRSMIEEALGKVPEEADTLLIAMGACGNCWEGLSWKGTMVIPRMDDCVTILLHENDKWHPNLKKPGHFYQFDRDDDHFLPTTMYKRTEEKYGEKRAKRICNMMFESYTHVDVVDTDVFDCHEEKYVARMQKEADFVGVPLGFVKGSNLVIEKLVSGKWDDQFIIVKPKTPIEGRQFLEIVK